MRDDRALGGVGVMPEFFIQRYSGLPIRVIALTILQQTACMHEFVAEVTALLIVALVGS